MNHHDALFKKAFGIREIAASYLSGELPASLWERIAPDSLNQQAESYVSEGLEEAFSDVVYTAQMADNGATLTIAFLFEHKSSQPDCIHQQLGRYMFGIWQKQSSQKERITPILPFIIYHGGKPWRHHTLYDCFETLADDLRPFVPNFRFYTTDLHSNSLEEINQKYKQLALQLLFRLFYVAYKEDTLAEKFTQVLAGLQEIFEQGPTDGLGKAMVTYLLRISTLPKPILKERILSLPPKIQAAMKTTYDQIYEEGLEQGIEKGIEKGRGEGINLTLEILQMYRTGKTVDFIAQALVIPKREVQKVIETVGRI